MNILLFLYIGIVIFQIIFLHLIKYFNNYYNIKSIDKKIKINCEYYNEITQQIIDELIKRCNLLKSGKMKYTEWIKYNNENNVIEVKGNKYYFFAYEQGEDTNIIRAIIHLNKNYINLSWTDILKDQDENFIFLKNTTDHNLIKEFIEAGRYKVNSLKYYWIDAIDLVPVLKESNVITIPATNEHGVITLGIGIDLKNLDKTNMYMYIDKINLSNVFFISLITIITSVLVLNYSNTNKSIIFLLLTNIYLLYFLNSGEYISSPEIEIKKIDQINNSILSISFLIVINTFIISSLTKTNIKLFRESSILFSISIILLLISTITNTNIITINDLTQKRLGKQLIFNFSILLNIFIVINYYLSVTKKK